VNRLAEVFYVYMLRCSDGSLYTGQTNDLEKRLRQHLDGSGAKYVRGRRPFELAYVEEVSTRSEALKREIALRRLSKKQKEQLVSSKGFNKANLAFQSFRPNTT
jgi:putative endonuclease